MIALSGFAGGWATGHPHSSVPILAIGRIIETLRSSGCERIVLAGAVERPSIDPTNLDADSLSWLRRFAPFMEQGDDGLLRAVRAVFEDEGFAFVSPAEILNLYVAEGVLGSVEPSAMHERDAERGEAILSALSPLDVGQGCVVAEGRVLGIETVQGTDALLGFVKDTRQLSQGARGGVLIKRAKAGQDREIDAPTIGPGTVKGVAAAGLDGIALGAGEVQIVEREAAVAASDGAGLFLWARS